MPDERPPLDVRWGALVPLLLLLLSMPVVAILTGDRISDRPEQRLPVGGTEMHAALAPICLGVPSPLAPPRPADGKLRTAFPIRLDRPGATRSSNQVPEKFDTVACMTESPLAATASCGPDRTARATSVTVSVRDASSALEIGTFAQEFAPDCQAASANATANTGEFSSTNWTAIGTQVLTFLNR